MKTDVRMIAASNNNVVSSSHLWFEFLIHRDKLLEHLKQPEPDPSPTVLLVHFIDNAEKSSASLLGQNKSLNGNGVGGASPATGSLLGGNNFEAQARMEKIKNLKAMALQVAAHLNWDLEVLATLPIAVQHSLMKFASEYSELNQFICSINHRWVLRSCQTPLRKPNQLDPTLDQLSKMLTPEVSFEAILGLIDDKVSHVTVPTPATFAANNHDFTIGNEITFKVFSSILNTDLGIYQLYKGNSSCATEHLKKAQPLPKNSLYFKLPKAKMDGYFRAVGILPTDPDSPEDTSELKAVEFARLLRKGQTIKIKKLVGGSNWDSGAASGKLKDSLQLQKLDEREPETLVELERRLIETQIVNTIKELLVKLHALTAAPLPGPSGTIASSSTRSFWKLFSNIEIPIPVQHAVNKFPPGAFQDYISILVTKSKQFSGIKLFQDSRAALQLARVELNEQLMTVPPQTPFFFNITLLMRLLEWEQLLVDLTELFQKWPALTSSAEPESKKFMLELNQKCKEVLLTSFRLNKANDMIPRSEVVEMAVMALLNLGEYAFVVDQSLNKWPFLEFLTLLAKVCIDLVERKEASSNYRELWHAVLPNFSVSSSKRQQATKNAGLVSSRAVFMWVVERSHSQLLVSLFVSLLARFHNHVQDDVTLQINSADFLHIWPNILDDVTTSSEMKSRVSGSSKLNATYIFDVLLTLLNRAQYSEPSWLKCIGDVYLASVNPAQAMKSYLEYLALTTDFFEKHSAPNWNDNSLFRRMIKCCELMQAPTQAMILCQFLTDVDYSLAFGKAQVTESTDASDALYGFIWDLTILEFLISLHSKRNDLRKKQQAIKVMGLLELNANNSEEIQREAMNLRKSQFMRTLAKLYIFT